MKRWLLGVSLLILLFVIVLSAKGPHIDPLEVVIQPVGMGQIKASITAVGELVSAKQREIRGDKFFIVSHVLVKEGQQVSQGQPLIVLESSQWVQELLQRQMITSVEMETFKKALDLAKAMLEYKTIARQQVDETQIKYQKARSEYELAQRELHLVQQLLSLAKRPQEPPFIIQSPMRGTVTTLMLKEGEVHQAHLNEPLLIISDMAQLKVIAAVNPMDSNKVQKGQSIEFSIPFQNLTLTGRVSAIASEVTDEKDHFTDQSPAPFGSQTPSKFIRVICQLEVPEHLEGLKLGLTGEVRVITDIHENVLLIPVEAILSDGSTRFVYLAKDGHAERREIKTGISNQQMIEVLEGLNLGESVITRGQFLLKNKDSIRLTNRL